MKKIKKIKPKHLARVGLFAVLLVGILSMLCAFTYPLTVVIDKTNTPTFMYYGNRELIDASLFTNNVYTDVVADPPSLDVEFDYLLKVYEGAIFICNPFGQVLEELVSFDEGTLSDGYYQVVFFLSRLGDAGEVDTDFVVEGVETYASINFTSSLSHFYSSADIYGSTLKFVSVATDFELEPIEINCFILVPTEPLSVTEPLNSVWSGVLNWITRSIASVSGIFWTGSRFTLIGTLAIVGVGIAILLLIFYKVKDFLHLR